MGRTEKLHVWIKSVIDSNQGLTQKGLAQAMGLNPAAVNRMLYGERKIKVDELPLIENYLGERYERPNTVSKNIHHMIGQPEIYGGSSAALPRGFNEDPQPMMMGMQDAVPVYGNAMQDISDGLNLEGASTVDWVARHPMQRNLSDAFAVYVFSDDMSPRYFTGELVYIHPARPPVSSKDCLVKLKDGQCLIRQYRGQDENHIHVRHYNPETDESLSKDNVAGLYLIVGRS